MNVNLPAQLRRMDTYIRAQSRTNTPGVCSQAADRIEALEAELATERAKTRTERDLRRRYGIAYAKRVQQLHEAAEDHAQSLAALAAERALADQLRDAFLMDGHVENWDAKNTAITAALAAHRAARTPQEKP